MSEGRTYYRPGLIFLSKPAGYIYPLIEPKFHTYADGSREQIRPFMYADFGEGSGNRLMTQEFVTDSDGKPLDPVHVQGSEFAYSFRAALADIRGGVFSLDDYAARMGLSEEEREQAARRLVQLAEDPKQPDVWLYERPIPQAPWDGFDDTHHHKVVETAETIGKLQEALDYLRYHKKWPGVQEKLAERIAAREAERVSDEQLSAA